VRFSKEWSFFDRVELFARCSAIFLCWLLSVKGMGGCVLCIVDGVYLYLRSLVVSWDFARSKWVAAIRRQLELGRRLFLIPYLRQLCLW